MTKKLTPANFNISSSLEEGELDQIQHDLELKFQEVLKILKIDQEKDPNTKGTARRVAKMYVKEFFAGRFTPAPDMTTFPNTDTVDELVVIGPIAINSTCSHHFVPIIGQVWVGYLPKHTLLGLSKFHRAARHVFRRPQIQEEATMQLALLIEEVLEPIALGVVVKAKHFCCSCRGVEDAGSIMTTQVMRGEMKASLKSEFLQSLKD